MLRTRARLRNRARRLLVRVAAVASGLGAGNRGDPAADWAAAITHLSQVVRNEPDNADAHNALGFAYRNGKRIDSAFRHFREALRLDPKLKSAHENIGEAYLTTGNKAKAREHLAALERLCGKGCDEQRNLAKAIAAAK